MLYRTLVAAAVLLGVGIPDLPAQTTWKSIHVPEGGWLLADSNSWVRQLNGMVSVRFLTVESRVDGKPTETGTVQYMDFDCTKQLYRLRRTEFVKGEKVVAVLPDSMGATGWKKPNAGWAEEKQLQAACKPQS